MTIIPLYKAILASMGCSVDNEGLVSMDISGLVVPVNVEGRRMAIPTPERLRFGDWSQTVAFHPLSENLVRGESSVLRTFKTLIIIRVHTVVHELLQQLTTLSQETHRHSKLSPKAQEFLSAIPEADQKSVDAMLEIIEAAGPDSGSNRLVSVFLKRNGLYRTARYSRVARVSFPLLEQFESSENGFVAGVKLRRKDLQGFQNLIQYIFPDALDADKYSAPSASMVAPNFDALLQAFLKLARRLNYVVETHREHLENVESLLIDTSWEDAVSDLSIYNGQIPSLSGNEGDLLEPETTTKPITPTTVMTYNTPEPPQSVVPKLPSPPAKSVFNTDLSKVNAPPPQPFGGHPVPAAPVKKGNGIDFNAAMEARQRAAMGYPPVQQPQQPMGYPAPTQYAPPAPPAYQYPPYGGHVPAPAPQVRWERGIQVVSYPTPGVPGLPPGMHPGNAPAWMLSSDSRIPVGHTAPPQQPYGMAPVHHGVHAPVYGGQAWNGGSAV